MSAHSQFAKLFRRTPKTIRNPKPAGPVRLAMEPLEDRLNLSPIDYTALIGQINAVALTHVYFKPTPTHLYLNFDGFNLDQRAYDNPVNPAQREADIQEILFRTSEIFAPFNVQVSRIFDRGHYDQGNDGSTTVFVGDNSANTSGSSLGNTVNSPGGFTNADSVDYPGAVKGRDNLPNSDGHDVAFVDPYSATTVNSKTGNYGIQSPAIIAGAIAHEAGHTFGLAHVRTDGKNDSVRVGTVPGTAADIMSYTDANNYFANTSYTVTDWNQTPGGLVEEDDDGGHPKYSSLFNNFALQTVTSQNSFSYLQAILGPRPNDGDRHVAHSTHVDPLLRTFYQPQQNTIGLNEVKSGQLSRDGDYDVYSRVATVAEKWTVSLAATAGNALTLLQVYDSDNKTVALNGDGSFTTVANKSYYFVVGSVNGVSANSKPLSAGYQPLTAGYQLKVKQGLFDIDGSGTLRVRMADTLAGNDGRPDTVTIATAGNNLTVSLNGGPASTYETLRVKSIAFTGSSDADTLTLRDSRLTVSAVGGGGGADRLVIDDTPVGTPLNGFTYDIQAGQVDRSYAAPVGKLGLARTGFAGFDEVRVVLPAATNAVVVAGLPAKLTIQATTAGSFPAHNTLTVNSGALTNARTLDFQGGTPDDKLVISDNTGAGNTTTINPARIDVQPAPIPDVATPGGSVMFAGLESVAVTAVNVAGRLGVPVGRKYIVAGWDAATPLSIAGAGGADSFDLGAGNFDRISSAQAFPAAIQVSGGGGTDTLVLNDSQGLNLAGNTNAPSWDLNGGSASRSNVVTDAAGGKTVRRSVQYDGVEAVSVLGSYINDAVRVSGTAAGTTLAINTGSGDDTVAVGDMTNTLGNLFGPLAIDTGAGADSVRVIDSAAAGRVYTVNPDNIAVGGQSIGFVGAERVALTTGRGGDTLTVNGTATGTTVALFTDAGNDRVSANFATLLGPLAVDAGAGTDTVTLTDRDNSAGRSYVLDGSSVVRDGADAKVSYAGAENLSVTGTTQQDSFYIAATPAGTTTTLNGGAEYDGYYFGYDAHTVDGIQGRVRVTDRQSYNLLTLDDAAAEDAHTYAIVPTAAGGTLLQRSGSADIDLTNYGSGVEFAYVQIVTGTAADAVSIQSLPASYSAIPILTEGDRVVVGSDPAGENGTARNVLGRVVAYSTGPVTFTIDDSADTVGRDVYVLNDINEGSGGLSVSGLTDNEVYLSLAPGSDVRLRAGGGDDTVRVVNPAGPNLATVDAGGGVDTIDYSYSDYGATPFSGGVYVDLEGTTATGLDQAVGFENVVGSVGPDTILGDDGDNLILGHGGDDVLVGRAGNDILIGGYGSDTLVGGAGDDLLIGGATAYDGYTISYFGAAVPLAAIQQEWSRTDIGYDEKIAHITGDVAGGLNGATYLTADQTDDDAVNWLAGNEGQDWFLGAPDAVADWEDGERVG